MQDKYNHHFLPRLYLKGFVCDDDPAHITFVDQLLDFLDEIVGVDLDLFKHSADGIHS